MDTLLRLFLAHFIADYFLQTPKMVSQKMEQGIRSPLLLVHAGLHIAVSMLLLFDLTLTIPVLLIGVVHYWIDIIKVYLSKIKEHFAWYVLDQLAHYAVIICVWLFMIEGDLSVLPEIPPLEHVWIIALAFLTLSQPTSITLKIFLSKWTAQLNSDKTLSMAGSTIGVIERFLVLIFILSGNWEAIGFLIAAKSVFRFSDLKDAHNRQLTEYILIGTLSSFGIAIVVGMLSSYLLAHIPG